MKAEGIPMKVKKTLLIITGCLALIYGLGVFYAKNHFLPNSYVDDTPLYGQNYEQLDSIPAPSPSLTIIQQAAEESEPVIQQIPSCTTLNYKVSELLNSQDPYLWFMSFFRESHLAVTARGSFDGAKLAQTVSELYCLQPENSISPEDARIIRTDDGFAIQPENDGCQINPNEVNRLVFEQAVNLTNGVAIREIDLLSHYDKAQIRSDDPLLIEKTELYNQLLNKQITITVSSSLSRTLGSSDICHLLNVRENELIPDSEAVNVLISQLYDSSYVSRYKYINKDTLRDKLNAALLSESGSSISADWITLTKRVIEVSLSKQTLYYYENDKLIFTSPVVTGKNGDTPTGNFTVTDKSRNCTLRGAGYTNFVQYWIGFDKTGNIFGFHDASWRSEFGGDIYLSDPSHGCVNMPTDKVQRLYNSVVLGTEVKIHY